ncbi:hypothetical protein Barb6XT_01608 [Bacteroidales bacterium Barb6XT]|nr:hypothetical protein Barb6XT_01608 [Bacteroidales bacterium Barb6XT]
MKQLAGIDISKDGFHACLKEQPDDGRVKKTQPFVPQ